AAVALLTLVAELGLVWMLFLPRRWRIACFFIVTPFQIGIILTANLTFLNHFVLALGFLLLDDRFLCGLTGRRWLLGRKLQLKLARSSEWKSEAAAGLVKPARESSAQTVKAGCAPESSNADRQSSRVRIAARLSLFLSAVCLSSIFYDT